ncbi:MAG: bifunctional protein GlmU [marine bacterium B5-7]|nr:MAG: bifunctional protein GlmU [marine bacterium B5-7]
MSIEVIILAAGKGTRMKSNRPKVLHPLAGRPLISHVLDSAQRVGADRVSVVHGHGADEVRGVISDPSIRWVLQESQRGTGHAVKVGLPDDVPDETVILVMYGDVPLIDSDTLNTLIRSVKENGGLAILTIELNDPLSYGRIIRDDDDAITRIVEVKEATQAELDIHEINTGFIAAPRGLLADWLERIGNDNTQGEYYLTDVVAVAVADGISVEGIKSTDEIAVQGVNSRIELARLERHYQTTQAICLMGNGVTLADPARIDVRGKLTTGNDCFFDINLVIEGEVHVGNNVRIGPNCVIRNSDIGDDAIIEANSVIEGANIGARCAVGPFARVRPGTMLDVGVRLGNFVETKQAQVGAGTKINHLSYIGDSIIGRDVNIGAGVITCNYDGANKHTTTIGDNAFIGSDSQLVAPVTIGRDATIGAGTTLTRNAPESQLTVSRHAQQTFSHWRRPKKKT